jgi:hypothetical protein
MNNRAHQRRHQFARSRWTDYRTPMMEAYIDALLDWAARHAANATATIAIPTGIVSVGELVRVLAALDRARDSLNISNQKRALHRKETCSASVTDKKVPAANGSQPATAGKSLTGKKTP